ncbi:TauD/TfdA family dioxygenase [Streptacidiphilus sp. P02-A3a]|uniref:TauD/TfdA family dioxygenase n=1 Tax=Streptacidiphilus sp. P02-A3a TaxID=2704468 RepID=UPI0015FE1902|nr:TauD/TfdA family dioxygenase [Streptacidiphilus sp. P02-A3a]QMU71793.1 L-asparagine oxygenase [Streptacidiphilus sp. P02-A3a]
MPPVLTAESHDSVVTLDPSVSMAVETLAADLLPFAGGRMDDPAWIRQAGRLSHDLPAALRKSLAAFGRDPGAAGSLLIRGLPFDEELIGATPSVSGSVQREATIPASVLMLLTHVLGEPISFRPEKSGAMVHDVVPVPGSEESQGNEGSDLLTFHNENAFHHHRPDFVLLLCVRADHDRVAGLRTASIRQVHHLLGATHRETLFRPEFTTAPPPSFALPASHSEPHPVLSGAPDDPDLLVDFAATEPLTDRAAQALLELQRLFSVHALTHRLLPGDLAVVDNRVTAHGRTGFVPRYDGRDRWLHRTFATQNLRRSRIHRADDGHVLTD